MSKVTYWWFALLGLVALLAITMLACAPSVTPTATPTKAPAAAPTKAPEPAKPAEPTKAPAPAAMATPAVAATTAAPPSPTKPPAPVPTALPKAEPAPLDAVKLGTAGGSISQAGVFVAIEKGYFREQGINVELTPFDSAARFMPALAAGQLDVGSGAAAAGLFNAVQRGIAVKVVADQGRNSSGHGFAGLVVRKDLADSGQFKGYADLRGKTLATNAFGSGNDHQLIKAIEKGNIVEVDALIPDIQKVVKIVEMPFPDMVTALGNKSIDAGMLLEPLVTQAVAKNVGVRWAGADEFYPNGPGAVVLFAPHFALDKADVARRYITAYLKAVRDYNDAFEKNKGKAEMISILMKHTTVKDRELYDKMVLPWINPDGQVNVQSVVQEQEWFFKQGFVQEKVDVNKVVDHQFVEFALQRLGKY